MCRMLHATCYVLRATCYMIILGIDPGVERMGYGVISVKGTDAKVLAQGLISTKKDVAHGERLVQLGQSLEGLIALYKPERIAVEKLFFQKNIKTAMKVGEARGIIMMLAAKNNIPTVELTPNEVKVAIAGYGNADKRQVQKMVKTLLSLKEIPKPDDVADALAIAYSGSFYPISYL